MKKVNRLVLVFVLGVFVAAIAAAPSVLAERRGNGGNNQGGHNSNQDNDDKDKDKNKNKSNNSNNQGSNNSSNSNNQQLNNANAQQMLQGGSNNSNKNRSGGHQGSSQNLQQLKKKNNDDNINNNDNDNDHKNKNKQFQNFQQQGGQGNFQFGNGQPKNWQQNKWNGSHNIQNWSVQFNSGPQPFSAKWFDDHPKAWCYHHDNWDDHIWFMATVPGCYSWLGWDDYPHNTVIYQNAPPFDPSLYGDWYPVGVYSLVTGPYDSGTRILQLSFDRQGNIAGTYYDMISDTTRELSGRVHHSSQQAEWSVNTNGALTFRAQLADLFQPQGIVMVQLPGGEQQWQLVRLQYAD